MDVLEAFLKPPVSSGETSINTGTFQVNTTTQESAVAGATAAEPSGAGDTYDENDQEVSEHCHWVGQLMSLCMFVGVFCDLNCPWGGKSAMGSIKSAKFIARGSTYSACTEC